MGDYHYTECGLDNVFIKDMIQEDHGGEATITIPAVA